MYTNGIHIINARCNIEQNTPIECEFALWSITEQQEHTYSVWVSNGEGLSTLKKKKRSEWETIYQGNRWDLANLLQQTLSDWHSWTWREFVFYVAGWCDANRSNRMDKFGKITTKTHACKVRVSIDGVDVTDDAFEADDAAGYADCYLRGDDGKWMIDKDTNSPVFVRRYGNVLIEWK